MTRVSKLDAGFWRWLLAAVTLALAASAAVWSVGVHSVKEQVPPVEVAAGWYCPMHPNYTSDHEGTCPICGMALVKNSLGQTVRHSEQIHVPAAEQQRIGVVLEPAEETTFAPTVVVPASVVADERGAVTLSPKVEGWIRKLGVSVVGQPVRKGQVLYEVYSPELLQRQRDYLDILTRRDALLARAGSMGAVVGSAAPDLMMASVARERFLQRNRLAAADVPESVLAELDKVRKPREVVPVLAEHDGVVTSIGAREGAYVMPAQPVLGYSDPGAVWAELTLTQEQLRQAAGARKVGLRLPEESMDVAAVAFDARQAVVDPASRTFRVRVPLHATKSRLLPGTLLEAEVQLSSRRALMVRKDAVLRTGRGDFVMVADGNDHFRQVEVRLGSEAGGSVEVSSGLVNGQQVVVNGQFLLGAEASMQASRQRLAKDNNVPSGNPPADAGAHAEAHPMPDSHHH